MANKDIRVLDVNIDPPSASDRKKYELDKLTKMLDNKSNQWVSQNGMTMGAIDFVVDNEISLNTHYQNSINKFDFIESVADYMARHKFLMTESDRKELSSIYDKYNAKMLK